MSESSDPRREPGQELADADPATDSSDGAPPPGGYDPADYR